MFVADFLSVVLLSSPYSRQYHQPRAAARVGLISGIFGFTDFRPDYRPTGYIRPGMLSEIFQRYASQRIYPPSSGSSQS